MSVDLHAEDELRAAIGELAAEARPTTRILAALQHRPADRWRRLAPFGAMIAVLAVVAIVLVLTVGRTNTKQSAPPAGPRPLDVCPAGATTSFTTFTIAAGAGVTPESATTCADVQMQGFDNDNGFVLLYRAGAFVSSELTQQRPAHDGVIWGYTGYLDGPPIGDCRSTPSCHRRAFAWRYAPQSWGVVVTFKAMPTSELEHIAAAVRPERSVPLRFPATFAGLPFQLRVMDVHDENLAPAPGAPHIAPAARIELRSAATPCSADLSGTCRPTVTIEAAARNGPGGSIGGRHITRTTINGTRVEIEPGSGNTGAFAAAGTKTCGATLETAPGFSEAQLLNLIKLMRFVPDCSRPQTWPTADDALPR
jgi:hypothetical protein